MGLTDAASAAQLGIATQTYTAWRIRRDLPPSQTATRYNRNPSEEDFVKAFLASYSDAEAARILQIAVNRFIKWRQYHELPSCASCTTMPDWYPIDD